MLTRWEWRTDMLAATATLEPNPSYADAARYRGTGRAGGIPNAHAPLAFPPSPWLRRDRDAETPRTVPMLTRWEWRTDMLAATATLEPNPSYADAARYRGTVHAQLIRTRRKASSGRGQHTYSQYRLMRW
ncbi:hypothetical protein EW145_g691 [Phellinidium pouzarii]|uniref:Uncharacterized protein n=1 Tax=Phellinidium pouzarii TaxID=167371 RepID=A0A4S4LI10_9AGAM|nr:hypothetical protein EW145_g691 [Phellinidium pouzarii]